MGLAWINPLYLAGIMLLGNGGQQSVRIERERIQRLREWETLPGIEFFCLFHGNRSTL